MAAVLARVQAELRTRWRSWVGLMLLLGLAGGVVMALVAGARRTDTAFDRLVAAERPADLELRASSLEAAGDRPPVTLDSFEHRPGVAEKGRFLEFATDQGDNRNLVTDIYFETLAPADRGAVGFVSRWKLLAGRHADPGRVDEAVVGFTVAEQYRLRVGSRLRLRLLTREKSEGLYQDGTLVRLPPPSAGRQVELEVVGVVAPAGQFPPRVGVEVGAVMATPAFARAFRDRYPVDELLRVRATDADALRRLGADVERLTGKPLAEVADTGADERALTRRSLHLPAVALRLLAALAAAAALLVAGQALARQAFLETDDTPTLRALGMSGGHLWGIGMLRAALVGAGGAVVAVAVALALSGLFPLGLAGTAEPRPGPAADALPLVVGAALFLVAVLVLAAVPAWRAVRPVGDAPVARPSAAVAALASAGVRAPGVVGVRLALEPGRGRTAVPVRATALGAVVAVATLAAALTLAASLGHFLRTPRLYGWNWDVAIGDGAGPDLGSTIDRLLASGQDIDHLSSGTIALLDFGDGGPGFVMTWATEPVRGSIAPTVIDGRAPAGPDEILLGARTLEKVGVRVGDQVEVRASFLAWQPLEEPGPPRRLRVVGSGVLPLEGGLIGEGAAITSDGLSQLLPASAHPSRNLLLLRWAPGVDAGQASAGLVAETRRLIYPQEPADVANFGRVENLPVLMAALVAAVALAMLVHVLVTSVRRRRRDLAVLKTLGFTRAQVSWTVAWQATTLVALALAVGLPVGVAVGRWLWALFASNLYVLPEPVVPFQAVLLLVPATVLAANLVAAVPAWMAARTRPAIVLRAE
jgi:ABC-type lipoprotein release transport system permease subunit